MPNTSTNKPKLPRIAIAGGSIAGLGAGVALHRAGFPVQIFERDTGPLRASGAGLVVQPELTGLINAQGMQLPVTRCRGRQYLSFTGASGPILPMPQQFTSWDAIYTTLHRQFPSEAYHSEASVLSSRSSGAALKIEISGRGEIEADLLIAADGANSPLRRQLLPELAPDYAGYIAWCGTVPEAEMTPALVDAFNNIFTFSDARSGGHALAYFIPGEGQTTVRGSRVMNWVWYVGANPAERGTLLTAKDGHQHHASLRRGMARAEAVAALHAYANAELHPLFARLVEKTQQPFLQSIVDLAAPRTVFGCIVLLGDAAFVARPHTAGGAAKAAWEAQSLTKALTLAPTDIAAALTGFERDQLSYGQRLLEYGIELGRNWARL